MESNQGTALLQQHSTAQQMLTDTKQFDMIMAMECMCLCVVCLLCLFYAEFDSLFLYPSLFCWMEWVDL